MSNDTGDTVVGHSPRLPHSPVDPADDTVVSAAEPNVAQPKVAEPRVAEPRVAEPKPPVQRRTEARTKNPRPASSAAIYSFRIGGLKDPIGLDRPARIGRRPTSPRVVEGAPPRLVRVVSPQREVSATHLEVRQLGVSIVITDLRSTNGTVVLVPGSTPRKLLQGESVVVSPGTLVDIGDENILQILPLDRRPS